MKAPTSVSDVASVAIGYVRVSSTEQAQEGVSLEVQKEKLRAYCKSHRIRLLDIKVDEGISGGTIERPGLQAALWALERGHANTLVVTKLDRLTRSVKDLCSLVDRFFSHEQFHLLSLCGMINTHNAAGRMMMLNLANYAQFERELVRERTQEAMNHLKSQGVALGQARFGFQYSKDVDANGRVEPWGNSFILGTSQLVRQVVRCIIVLTGCHIFDIRIWGCLHALIAVGGLALFLRAMQVSRIPGKWRIVIGLLAAIMLSDTSNVFLFNSFYYIGATLSGWLIGSFGLIAADGVVNRWRIILAASVSIAFVWSKIQLAPVGLLLAALLWCLLSSTDQPRLRLWLHMAAVSVLASSLALMVYPRFDEGVRRNIAGVNSWNALMAGIVANADNPTTDLHELGVDEEYINDKYIGKDCNAWMWKSGGDVFLTKWIGRVDQTSAFLQIAKFCVFHPGRFVTFMDQIILGHHKFRNYNLGIYEAGTLPDTGKQVSWWRSLRAGLFHLGQGLLWLLGLVTLTAIGATALIRDRLKRPELALGWMFIGALALMVLSQFILVPLMSGLPGIDKHLYPGQLLLDWLLLVLPWWIVATVRRWDIRKLDDGRQKT